MPERPGFRNAERLLASRRGGAGGGRCPSLRVRLHHEVVRTPGSVVENSLRRHLPGAKFGGVQSL